MENASKALTIAGGVLIAIMVVGLFVFGFQRLRSYQNTQDASKKTEQLTQFNNALEAYNKNVVPGYQMISLAHLVIDLNTRSANEGYDEIKVEVDMNGINISNKDGNIVFKGNKANLVTFVDEVYDREKLQKSGDENSEKAFKEMYFMCTDVKVNQVNGRINKMSFKRINKK